MMMKKTLLLSAAILCGSLFLPACTTRAVLPEEILQVPKYAVIRTAYNMWYTDPMKMTNENVQVGTIIPFGTEIQFETANSKEVNFKIKDKHFRITLTPQRMEVMPEFIARSFTTKTAEELAPETGAAFFEKMKRGTVMPGMTRDEVLLVCGSPSPARTPSLDSDTWIFQLGPVKGLHVIFKDGKVLETLELQ